MRFRHFANGFIDSIFYGHLLGICSNLINNPCVFLQRFAGISQVFISTIVDIQHPDGRFDIAFSTIKIGIAQLENRFVRLGGFAIVEYDEPGGWYFYQGRPIKSLLMRHQILFDELCCI